MPQAGRRRLLESVKLGERGESHAARALRRRDAARRDRAAPWCTSRAWCSPTSRPGNLDPESAKEVLALLRECVKGEGAAGILVTHSSAAARTADKTYVLTEGGLRAKGMPAQSGQADRRRGEKGTAGDPAVRENIIAVRTDG